MRLGYMWSQFGCRPECLAHLGYSRLLMWQCRAPRLLWQGKKKTFTFLYDGRSRPVLIRNDNTAFASIFIQTLKFGQICSLQDKNFEFLSCLRLTYCSRGRTSKPRRAIRTRERSLKCSQIKLTQRNVFTLAITCRREQGEGAILPAEKRARGLQAGEVHGASHCEVKDTGKKRKKGD